MYLSQIPTVTCVLSVESAKDKILITTKNTKIADLVFSHQYLDPTEKTLTLIYRSPRDDPDISKNEYVTKAGDLDDFEIRSQYVENTEYDTKIPLVQSYQKGTSLSNDYGLFNEAFDQNPTAFQETISDDYTEYGKDFLEMFVSLFGFLSLQI